MGSPNAFTTAGRKKARAPAFISDHVQTATKAGGCWTAASFDINHFAMDLRRISDSYFVAPQLDPEELQAVADAGFVAIICNRPDEEVPVPLQAEIMRQAAQAARLEFHYLPLTHQTFTPQLVQQQRAIAESVDGPVLAYCASGTRSTIAWALGQAGSMPVEDILSAARDGGYDLSTIRPTLQAAASHRP